MKSSTTNVDTSINEEVFHEVSESFQGESSSSSLNDDVQQSTEEVILPQTNTQSISNNVIPNVDEASTSRNVFNERLKDAYFDASTSFHDPSNVHTFYQPYPHEKKWTKDNPLHKIIGDPKSSNAPPTLKDLKFWTAEEKKTRKIDHLARSILIQGLPNDIYSLIDSNETAKDLWDAHERQMRGFEYGEQDRKAAILYEYETFKAIEGEQLLDTYPCYLQVINDLKKCSYKKDNFGKPVDHTDYRSMIGSLMYVTSSRPDIMFATCMCVRYQANPNEHHVSAVKRTFRYLKRTINLGLWYPKDYGFDLTAYSDADHAECHLDRKTESEYVAISSCCAQVLWMRTQLTDYVFFYDKVPIYCDSKSAIAISCNPVQHTFTKHIDVRCKNFFSNPLYLKKSQKEKPCLYNVKYDKNDLANLFAPESNEKIRLAEESRSKLCKAMVEPYDYTRQNSLYELFTPQTEKSREQMSFSNEKLIAKMKGKFVDTKFEKPSIVRQPNAFKFQRPSVLGKPSPLSNSPFSKSRFIPTTNVNQNLSKPVTPQILPQIERQAVRNTNVIKPGINRIDIRPTQTRTPQVPQTFRSSNSRGSTSTRVIHKTSVSRPQLRSTQMKEKVMPNNSQIKIKKKKVEDHHRISSFSNKTKSVTVCNDSLKSRTSNVNVVCVTCGKCVFNLNHDACVSKFINNVNARTKKPKLVPIITRKPTRQLSQSVATTHKKTVALESTIQKSKSYFRMLCEKISKT
nr:hypothetical protein [Tanacetum cinerariifolium]